MENLTKIILFIAIILLGLAIIWFLIGYMLIKMSGNPKETEELVLCYDDEEFTIDSLVSRLLKMLAGFNHGMAYLALRILYRKDSEKHKVYNDKYYSFGFHCFIIVFLYIIYDAGQM